MEFSFAAQQSHLRNIRTTDHAAATALPSKENVSPEDALAPTHTPSGKGTALPECMSSEQRIKRWVQSTGSLDHSIASPSVVTTSPMPWPRGAVPSPRPAGAASGHLNSSDHFNKWVAATASMQFTPAATPPSQNKRQGALPEDVQGLDLPRMAAFELSESVSEYESMTPASVYEGKHLQRAGSAQPGSVSASCGASEVSAAMSKLLLREGSDRAGGVVSPGRQEQAAAVPQPMLVSPMFTAAAAGSQLPVLQDGVLVMTGTRAAAAVLTPMSPMERVLELMTDPGSPEEVQPLQLQFEEASAAQDVPWEDESDDELPVEDLALLTPIVGPGSSDMLWRATSAAALSPLSELLAMMVSPGQQQGAQEVGSCFPHD